MTTQKNLIASLLLSTSLATGAVLAQNTSSTTRERLIEQIHSGETLYRDDLVDDAVQRLYRIEPEAPEGLVAQIHLAVKRGFTDQAKALLGRLQKVAPDSLFYRQGAALIRIAGESAQADLTQARLFSSVGRIEDARKAYDRVFQGVYPTADFAYEYWQLRSREPNSRALALEQLRKLNRTYPRHPGTLLALANFSLADGQTEQGLSYLHRLAEIAGQRETAAAREFDYLATLPVTPESVAAWRDFTKRYTGLTIQARAQERLDAQSALVSDPVWRAGRVAIDQVEAGTTANVLPALRAAVNAYPKDPAFLGALGIALLRANNRADAMRYFQLAKDNEPLIDQTSRWDSLIKSAQEWLAIEQADKALQSGNLDRAERLYRQVAHADPRNIFAFIGLGDIALARKLPEQAWLNYRKAFIIEPANESAQNGMGRYLYTLAPDQALSILEKMPRSQQKYLSGLRQALELANLETLATAAIAQGKRTEAIALLTQAQALNLADPWLSYRLAGLFLQEGQTERAMAAFNRHLAAHTEEPASRYAQALLLESTDAWSDAVTALKHIDRSSWTDEMRALEERLLTRERIAQATLLFNSGQTESAISALDQAPRNALTRLQVADWSTLTGHYERADDNYRAILADDPENLDARLGQLENWLAMGDVGKVKNMLAHSVPAIPDEAINSQRRLAGLWSGVGERTRARDILAQAATRVSAPDPLLFRDYARTVAKDNPQHALDLYQKAMVDGGILDNDTAKSPRDDYAFTRSMRGEATDDWLLTSIRADADALYQSQNTTVTLSNDGSIRTDGTPGISRLNANTTMLQIDHPLMGGKGFLRADYIRMNAGTFETTPTGEIDERFGTCLFSGLDDQGNNQSLPGCSTGLRQKSQGTAVGLGWQADGFGFDLGRTPDTFPVSNWVGGINVEGDIGPAGWSLALSRRPMSNSLLSLAGAVDPRTGTVWGGVLATGATLGLSWDQGGADGVWGSFGYHKLTGTNVASNTRSRLMGGYYRRLINEQNRLLTTGINLMYWKHQHNLGNYTLGQGGYYSPQSYASASLPVSYAQRTANWSFALRGSASYSASKTKDQSYFPLASPIAGPYSQLAALGVSAAGFQAANTDTGANNRQWGYSLSANVERRLTGHWVLGAGFDLQRSADFTPSRVMIYLRYSLEPWFGNLKLNPGGLTPYVDFN